jgi:hypothetical protein
MYLLVNKHMRESSEAFLCLDHDCRQEVLGPEPSFYIIASADSFSNRIYPVSPFIREMVKN